MFRASSSTHAAARWNQHAAGSLRGGSASAWSGRLRRRGALGARQIRARGPFIGATAFALERRWRLRDGGVAAVLGWPMRSSRRVRLRWRTGDNSLFPIARCPALAPESGEALRVRTPTVQRVWTRTVRDPPAGRCSRAVSGPWRHCGVGPHRRGRDDCVDVAPAGAADTGPWPVHRGYSVRPERRRRLCRRFSSVFLPAWSSPSASLVTTIWWSSGFGPRR